MHACHAQIARRANLPHARGVVERPKSTAHFAHPASMRGTYRDRHDTWSAGCDGRGWCRETYDIDASGGSDTPRLASSLQSMMCRRRRQQSLVSGESAEKAVKPSRRECRCFGFTCGDLSLCAFPYARKAAGAAQHPAFPAPSVFEGRGSRKTSDTSCRENAKLCPEK